ncbi:MAG: DUF3823 domain-containing protein [Tannerella sp.]|jgi:hypothetical protein|nr:DUF3823 domain-containing protein [Tannerella sp.]
MKKIFFYLIFLMTACEIDQYAEPAETLQGILTDPDGEPFITEQPHGFQIRMLEDGATQYYDFWGKADGSFHNSKIFGAKYSLMPYNGAFFPIDPVTKKISGVTTLNFVVVPFCKINADIKHDNGILKASFQINKAAGAGKLKNAQLIVSKWNPNVGMYRIDKSASLDLNTRNDDTLQGQTLELSIAGYLESGVTYYARVAALCDNPIGRYNMSVITQIIVP